MPRADVLPLLMRFPCKDEAARVAWWFDRPDLLSQDAGVIAAVAPLVDETSKKDPLTCFTEVQTALAAVDLDWRDDNAPSSTGPCDADLALARTYYEDVLTDQEQRRAVRPSLNRALVSSGRRDLPACLLATSEVRRAYLRTLGLHDGPADEHTATVAATSGDLPFIVNDGAVLLLEMFPCQAEMRRIAWWAARPDIYDRGLLGLKATPAVYWLKQGPVTDDPVACLGVVEDAVAALGLDWHAITPPLDGACDEDFALATSYFDGVFDGRLQVAALPALNRATIARHRDDQRTCLLSSAEVRRIYLSAVAENEAVRSEVPEMIELPHVPFPVRTRALSLLQRFPCDAERRRAAWWFDRPELLPSEPASRLLPPEAEHDPIRCFTMMRAALARTDLDWSASNPPPPGATCNADIALASAYFDRALDPGVQRRVRGSFGRALAAVRRGHHARCLIAVATVRRAYLDALGADVATNESTISALPEPGFRVREAAISFLERFPCAAEIRRATSWAERSELLPHPSAAMGEAALARLEGARTDPIACLVEAQAVIAALGIERNTATNSLLDGASCTEDLRLARTYHDAVFEGQLRVKAGAALEEAAQADREGDPRRCSVASAAVRQLYLATAGALTPLP